MQSAFLQDFSVYHLPPDNMHSRGRLQRTSVPKTPMKSKWMEKTDQEGVSTVKKILVRLVSHQAVMTKLEESRRQCIHCYNNSTFLRNTHYCMIIDMHLSKLSCGNFSYQFFKLAEVTKIIGH